MPCRPCLGDSSLVPLAPALGPMVGPRARPVPAPCPQENDGTFWMPWEELASAGFVRMDICDRTTRRDLELRVNEDYGPRR